jgi:hypothetical protein
LITGGKIANREGPRRERHRAQIRIRVFEPEEELKQHVFDERLAAGTADRTAGEGHRAKQWVEGDPTPFSQNSGGTEPDVDHADLPLRKGRQIPSLLLQS